jgi:hypothetical protein
MAGQMANQIILRAVHSLSVLKYYIKCFMGAFESPVGKICCNAPDQSEFKSVTAGENNTVYAAGCINGSSIYTYNYYFSDIASAIGIYSGYNAVLVKYNSFWAGQWS